MISLQEAFGKLNMIESADFDPMDQDQKNAMRDFLADSDEEANLDVPVVDEDALEEDELEDSYVGKIVIKCPVCQSLVFKTPEEFETDVKDQEISCPYCFSVEQFDVVGKIEPMEDETAPEEVEETDSAEETDAAEGTDEADSSFEVDVQPKFESFKRSRRGSKKNLREDLENVTIETDNDVINVSSQPKAEPVDDLDSIENMAGDEGEELDDEHEESEVIAPINAPDFSDEDASEDEEASEDEVDEVDEDSFDEMAESWFRENYNNIKSYRTTKFYDKKNHIKTEGILTLSNGKKKLTEFVIRPSKFNRSGKGSCLVENINLKKKFVVGAKVKNSNK